MGKSSAAKKKKKAALRAQYQQQKSQSNAQPEPESKGPSTKQPVNGNDNTGVSTGTGSAAPPAAVPSVRNSNAPTKPASANHQGWKTPVSKQKLTLPAGFESTDTTISLYYDYNHESFNRSSSVTKNHKGCNNKSSSRGGKEKGISFESNLITTAVEKSPELRILNNGFDMEKELKPWCCFGTNTWNGRRFAHNLSTNFSSPVIGSEGDMWTKVDFVSDWSNVKALIKSNLTDTHLSFLIHRVGNSVTIDELDLCGFKLFPDFLQLPEGFKKFVTDILAENEKKLKEEIDKGKTNEVVLRKEAYHQLLHRSMKSPMILKKHDGLPQAPSKPKFLHRAVLTTDKFKVLVGSDVPTYTQLLSEADDKPESVTVRPSIDDKSSNEALDLWLDNILMQCPKTLITSLKDTVVTKTDWVLTDDLPKIGKFDAAGCIEHAESVLNFINESVKPGDSYWLYRAPGSVEMKLYNLSNISRQDSNGTSLRIFENWELLAPFAPFFGANVLMKYAEFIAELVPEKLKTDLGLLDLNGLLDKNGIKASETKGKTQKLGHKLENHISNLESRLNTNFGWMIRNMEEITVSKFSLLLECLKGIYNQAMTLTPCLANQQRKHAVERFLLMCCKLRKLTSDKPEQSYPKEETKRWFMELNSGICDILSFLKTWYDGIEDPDLSERNDLDYLGCRLHSIYAEMKSIIALREFESPNSSMTRRLDQNLPPTDDLEQVVALLNRALELVPVGDFKIKHSLMPVTVLEKTEVPSNAKEYLQNELFQQLSVALFRLVSHQMVFPAHLSSQELAVPPSENDASSNDGHHSVLSTDSSPSSGFITVKAMKRKTYEDISALLDKCIYYGEKANCTIGTWAEFKEMNPVLRAKGLQNKVAQTLYSAENSNFCIFEELSNFPFILIPKCDYIFRLKQRGHRDPSKDLTFMEYEYEGGGDNKTTQCVSEPSGCNPKQAAALKKVCKSFAEITKAGTASSVSTGDRDSVA